MRIHHPAVLAAAVVHWLAGAAWYGAFTRPFTNYMGAAKLMELEARNEAIAFAGALLSSLVLAYVLEHLLRLRPAKTTGSQFQLAVGIWVGFIVSTQSLTVLFEGRHPGLLLLGMGYQLTAIMLMTAVLVGWRPSWAAL